MSTRKQPESGSGLVGGICCYSCTVDAETGSQTDVGRVGDSDPRKSDASRDTCHVLPLRQKHQTDIHVSMMSGHCPSIQRRW